MTNSTKTTKYSTILLAAILVAGTITTLFPSFMNGAQAVPYPDMDREKKADKKSVNVSSLKCNNINVNINGLELDVFPSFLGGGDLAAEAVEPNTDANSFAAGNNGDGSQINDFRFICINNNNNTVIQEQPPTPSTCEECFTTVITDEEELADLIQAFVEDGGPRSLQELCDFIEEDSGTSEGREFISDRLFVLGGNVGISEDRINEILDCLEKILGVDFPREILIESLSAQLTWESFK